MFSVKKRTIIVVSALLLTALTFIISINALSSTAISKLEVNTIKVVLDAGHGGIDGGVSGAVTKVKESELNLKVVKKLEKHLLNAGFTVLLTRTSDAGLYGVYSGNLKRKDMQKRKEIIEGFKPDMVISIHMNYYCIESRSGAQVFYRKEEENGKKLANCIQNSFNAMPEQKKNYKELSGDYYILNCTDYPSVICECGFLSNKEEESRLITEEYQEQLSYTIFKGIVDYLSVSGFAFCD